MALQCLKANAHLCPYTFPTALNICMSMINNSYQRPQVCGHH